MSEEERDESPLFEPGDGWGVQLQDDIDADTVMLSPPSTPASKDHMPSREKGQGIAVSTPGSRDRRPIIVESGPSSSDSDSDSETGSNLVVSMRHCLTPKEAQDLLNISPIPGDVSLIDEYIDTLKTLASYYVAGDEYNRVVGSLAEEADTISLALNGLPTKEKQHLATIAQACAKGIQTDMATPSIAADMSAIQATIEKRDKEAETARQTVPRRMVKRREELEARRLEILDKRDAALQKRFEEELGNPAEDMLERKAKLEEQGGMAMAVELGRRLERLESAKERQ